MVTIPELPPKQGYVEVELDGVRCYQVTPEQAEKEALETENFDLKTRLSTIQEVIDGILMGTINISGGGTT